MKRKNSAMCRSKQMIWILQTIFIFGTFCKFEIIINVKGLKNKSTSEKQDQQESKRNFKNSAKQIVFQIFTSVYCFQVIIQNVFFF